MNELIYYDLKQISGLSGSLSTQVSKELGRRIVAGIYTENDLFFDSILINDLHNKGIATFLKIMHSRISRL